MENNTFIHPDRNIDDAILVLISVSGLVIFVET